MQKFIISIYDLQLFSEALDTVHEYLTDNSCGDPDCCGGAYIDEDDYREAMDTIADLGLELEIDHTPRY